MRIPASPLLAAIAFVAATPASAGELFVGLHKHAVDTPLNLSGGLEQGADVSLGYRLSPVGSLLGARLQPYAFGAINTAGDTSYAAAGISARFGDRIYVRPGLGLAIHNGSSGQFQRYDRIAFGSQILFEPELAVGARLSSRLSLEASLIHMSHGTLFSRQNPGIDNLGARLNLAL